MIGKSLVFFCLSLSALGCAHRPWLLPNEVEVTEVATSDRRWTGIAVSQTGRVFVNYPLWSASQPFAVGEILPDGSVSPYPNERLNGWLPGRPVREHFVCVQAMYVDARDRLWILDPGNPRFEGVIDGAPKLFVVDLRTDEVEWTYFFGEGVVTKQSYLNDLRVDLAKQTVYMTDSGNGALVVLDIPTGNARRVLDGHPSTGSENVELTIGGRAWRRPDGSVPQVHADGIALGPRGAWLYYQALSGRTLYRVPTRELRDAGVTDEAMVTLVERVAESGSSDGLLCGPDGRVYTSALEHDAIRCVDPESGTFDTVIVDERICWPDSFALGPSGGLYVTTARIHEGDEPTSPFAIYRVTSGP